LNLEKLRKELYDCSRCGFCRVWEWKGVVWVCPTYPYTEAYDTQYARGRVRMAQLTLEKDAEITETFMKHAMQCTLCGSCAVHCPVGIPLFEVWHAWRKDMVEAGHLLPAHQRAAENIVQHHSIFGPRPGKQAEITQQKKESVSSSAYPGLEVLYFPGCQTNRKARSIGKATEELLRKLNVDYAVLEEDACCGYPMVDVGHMEAARQAAQHTIGQIRAFQPAVVLTTCIGCYRALTHVYPEELGLEVGATVQHVHEFFPGLLGSKARTITRKVTFHDPCIMGRHMGLYDEPRSLITSLPGVELVEMHSTREHSLCCGAGGGVLGAFDELAARVAVERLQQAAAAGAQQVVSSCPTCVVNLKRAVKKAGLNLDVSDIVELLNEAVPDARG
jgi:Fe-S oxidoreductase